MCVEDVKDPAVAEILSMLISKISSLEFQVLDLQAKLKKASPAKAERPVGVTVWEAYKAAFTARYKVDPVRNAKVNKQCTDIAKRIGEADGAEVARFYVGLNDPQFVRMNHPVGILLMNCESIHSMWQRGKMTTAGEARKVERRSSSVNASQNYLQRKHGRNDDQNPKG